MKTQVRTRSFRNLVVSAIVAASLNIAVLAQPNPAIENSKLRFAERFDHSMNITGKTVNYISPAELAIMLEAYEAMENLEQFNMEIENSLKYKATVESDDQMEQLYIDLEHFANSMMEKLKYRVPENDEFTGSFDEQVSVAAPK